MSFLVWILIGLVAGALAGKVMKGSGYGIVGDVIIGLLGGLVGGWLFSQLGLAPAGNVLYDIIVSFVGAVLLVWVVGMFSHKTV